MDSGKIAIKDLDETSLSQEDAVKSMPHFSGPSSTTAVPSPGPARQPGDRRFEGLEILAEIAPGVGGMGKVFKARDTSLDRLVAVKTMKTYFQTPAGRTLFEREARAAARLDHPNIVRILSFNPDHDPPYYVMQYVDGRALDDACASKSFPVIAGLFEQTAKGLAFAHEHGLVHRDIKPSNILVDQDGHAYLTDFGLAEPRRPGDVESPIPVGEGTAGTPQYLAPEVYAGCGSAGPAVDIYSLGVTLYKVLTGRHPFPVRTRSELRDQVLAGRPPLPQEVNPALPEPLQRICLNAMEVDPAHRYASAQAVADDLRRFIDGREVLARPTRYDDELRGKLRNHLTQLQCWREQKLITVHQMDRLALPHRRLLETDSPWHELSRTFPWETVALRVGGWCVLLSTILWPMFYWNDLTSTQRVIAIGFPTVAINIVGLLFHFVGNRWNVRIFLGIGALLLPIFVTVLLTESQWLHWPQQVDLELFWKLPETVPNTPIVVMHGARAPELSPTNRQMTVAAAVFLIHCLVLRRLTGATVFMVWLGIGLYALATGLLLMAGLRDGWRSDNLAWPLLCYLGLALTCGGAALLLHRKSKPHDAAVLYRFFPVPFAIAMTGLAWYGSSQWLGTPQDWDSATINLWWIGNGVLYFVISCASARASACVIRSWSDFFMVLVPISLLVPLHFLFEAGIEIATIGGNAVHGYELLAGLVALTLVGLGTRLMSAPLVIPGLLGVAVFVFRVTERHFDAESNVGWPLGVALVGGFSMAVAVASLLVRARRQHRL